MYRTFVFCIIFLFAGCDSCETCSDDNEVLFSDIKSDEHVVFFRTAGWLNEAKQEWHLPIQGWIYEPADSSARKELLAQVLEEKYGLTPTAKTATNFTRRVNLLIADSERDKTIVVNMAGRSYVLPPSLENGHFETTLTIPVADVERFADGGFMRYTAVTRESKTWTFTGEVRLVRPAGISIISDIDDTVKITNVTDRKSLLEHTFLLDFVAAPGMAQLYDAWSNNDISFHFVSSSPWQLYSPLREFLDSDHFPWATFSLKAVRFRDETLLNLFKKGTETKPAAIEEILGTYEGRKFVLVGDSGEQDPEVYAALIRKHPDQVAKIYIRNVTQETADNERFTRVFENVDRDRWQLFEDPQTLTLPSSP